MENVIYFVYLLTFSNGKIYVGMSRTDKAGGFTTRYRDHARAAKNGKDLPVYRAWRKYGAPAQIIIGKYSTRNDCAQAEIDFIAQNDATNPEVGYNLMPGGEGMHAPKGSAMHELMRRKVWDNPEVRTKLSAAFKGKPLPAETIAASVAARKTPEGQERMRRLVWENPEVRAKLSASTTRQMAEGGAAHLAEIMRERGDIRTPTQVAEQNARVKAFMNSPEGKDVAKRGYATMMANPENITKQRAGQDEWRASEANRENCRRIAKLSAAACARPVLDLKTGIEYPSQRAMGKALGMSDGGVSLRVKNGTARRL